MTLRFDLVDLQLFVHVVEAGSITAGSARAHLALASGSARIAHLEDACGVALLARGPRGVSATPAGDVLLRHARAVLGQLDRLRDELGEHAAGLKGQVRLLCNTAALYEYVPDALAAFMARHPHVDVDLEERTSADVARALREGAADLGILADGVDLSQLQTIPFRTDRLVAVAAPGLAFGGGEGRPVTFARLADFDHVTLAGDTALFRHLDDQARRSGRTLRARVRLRSFDAVCRMAASGVGVAIVPEPAARRAAAVMPLTVVALADAWALRHLVLAARGFADLPRHARQLVAELRR